KGAQYRIGIHSLSLAAHNPGCEWRIESGDGSVIAKSSFVVSVRSWGSMDEQFIAARTDPAARLVISTNDPGTIWIDSVSLTPDRTWKKHGLRADLAGKLADMSPAFVRFPGGCYCEGEVLKDRFQWKNSIGPKEQRPGHWDLWGYRSSDGLGY